MTQRGFYVYDVKTDADERRALAVLLKLGCAGRVTERDRSHGSVFVAFPADTTIPPDMREKLADCGITC